MAATIAGGGIYRKCPASMELGSPCEERQIFQDAHVLAPVLAAMEQAGDAAAVAINR